MGKGKIVVLLVFIMVLSLIRMSPPASADIGTPIDSGWASTPPIINGSMAPGEWAGATITDFTLQMRSRTDGSLNRTVAGKFYVENNLTCAFLAVQLFNDDYMAQDFYQHFKGLSVLFSDNDSAALVVGDNGEGVTTWVGSSFYSHNDLYYTGSYWSADFYDDKTDDGLLKWSHTNQTQGAIGNWTFEMMIPFVGTDGLAYDFNITSLPYTVGFKILFSEPSKGLDGVYPDDTTITKSIDQATNASTYGDLTFYPLYNLTMVTTAGGTTTPAPGIHQYPYKTVVSATATADPWYEFDHWELDGVNVGTASPYNVTMDMNHTLKAVFHALYALTIATTTGGTTTPVPGVYIYPNGTLVNVTATNSSGYMFDHWELDSVNVGASNPYTVTMNQNHTLKAFFVIQLSVTISPANTTINLGSFVAFTSNVTGGTPAYSYQWYVGSSPVPGATSATWTFTPTSPGIYYVYLNVTDSTGKVAISNTARVVIIPQAVGGYSVSLTKPASALPIVCYVALFAAFSGAIGLVRRKKNEKTLEDINGHS
jgi:hypothetical protein